MPVFKGLYYSINDENDSKELILTNNKKSTKVTGEMVNVLEQIIPLLDGYHSISEISSLLDLSTDYVGKVLDLLQEKNFVILNDVEYSSKFVKEGNELEKYFSNYLNNKMDILDQLDIFSNTSIYIIGNANIKYYLGKSLESIINVVIVNDFEEINVNNCSLLIACDTYENISFFKDVDKNCSINHLHYLKLVTEWNELKIGPIFLSGNLCYECYISRIYSNNPNYRHITKANSVSSENFRDSVLPGSVELLVGILKIQVIKFFSSILKSDIVFNEYVISLEDFTSQISPLYSLPNCEACNSEVYRLIESGEHLHEIK